jgi:hypothetical protein
MKLEATRSSGTSVYNKPTWRYNTDYGILHKPRRENLKSYIPSYHEQARGHVHWWAQVTTKSTVSLSVSSLLVSPISCAILDRLCGLVVRVLGYRSGGPDSIPGTTQKKSSGSGTGSTQPREYNWGATWKKSSGCLENREYGRRHPSRWPRSTLYPQKLAITSPTSGGRSVGIVRSRTQTMQFVCCCSILSYRSSMQLGPKRYCIRNEALYCKIE